MLPCVVSFYLLLLGGSKAQPQASAGETPIQIAGLKVATSMIDGVLPPGVLLSAQKRELKPEDQADTPDFTLRASGGPKGFDPKGLAFFQPAQVINASAPRPEGFIMFEYTSDNSAHIEVRLTNFPAGKGPFSYHIHEHRVPEEISDPAVQCLQANAHLDPEKRGDMIPCDTKKRNTCQAGDVSRLVSCSSSLTLISWVVSTEKCQNRSRTTKSSKKCTTILSFPGSRRVQATSETKASSFTFPTKHELRVQT